MEQINFFAETTYRGIRKKFGIKTDDRRRHFYVIGKTGMGKSAMLKNMAIQDIRNGNGIGFIDPHGELAEELLDFIPSHRINDVVYINPADLEYPIAFNVMEKVSFEHRHLVASGLMGVFKKIWPDVWSARMEYILSNTILALLEYPGSTLLGVNRMMSDSAFRVKVVERVTDPVIKSFWVNEFARYNERYEVEATAAIQNKVGQFLSNPLIRNSVGQVKSSINMREIMDSKKILIVNLSKGRIGEENSTLLGALLIAKIQLAAMSRVDIPEDVRNDFYLYVDEFQTFATESFANILSEARKYRLALILAHQYISQMDDVVRDAVFGNIGTLVSFRIGAEDAEFLEKEFYPEFVAQDLVSLAKYNIYLKLMIDGLAGRPFSAQTLPPFPKPEESNKEKIIKVSREKYSTSREKVEESITKWAGFLEMSPPTQKKKTATLYDATCSLCGKSIKVPFKPDGERPIYCKSCLKKINEEKASKQEKEERKEEKTEKDKSLNKRKIDFSEERIKEKTVLFKAKKDVSEEAKKKKERKKVDLKSLKEALKISLSKLSQEKTEKEKTENKENE